MKTKMFSVFDSAAGAFMAPFFTHSEGLAQRMFSEAAIDPKSAIAKHPGDYSLFLLGEFDDANALIAPELAPRRLSSALDFSVRPLAGVAGPVLDNSVDARLRDLANGNHPLEVR